MRIGIFGGSFNPVHNGHIHIANTVRREMKLDKIIIVPSKISPHKSNSEYATAFDRLEMCNLAFDEDFFEVSTFELDNDRTSYSIYTIKHLRKIYQEDELFLIVGSDMLTSFHTWFHFEEILRECSLVCLSRNDGDDVELEMAKAKLDKFGKIFIIKSKALPLSSTMIRKNIKNREQYSCYLPVKVVQYISKGNLYLNKGEF